MTGDPPPVPTPPPSFATAPRRSRRWAWPLVAFLLGVATVIVLLPYVQRWRESKAPAPAPVAATAAQPTTVTAGVPLTLEGLAAREAALDAQLRAIEGRLATADAGSRTAAGYATRAEGLMIAFAARRALDRGLALGYVEGQLRTRFGVDQPQAVATVIAAANAPLTREDLRLALDTIAPDLQSSSRNAGIWPALRRELSNLVVLRKETTPSPRAADRLARARRLLDAGNVEAALAEVARMPGAGAATSWIDAAKRYNAARRALEQLELAAISGGGAIQPAAPPVAAAGASAVAPLPGL
ncbi:hypothetical protein SAMN06297144_1034 [Sphingomonas guangdongensis]|uniref:Inner membrane protein n=1 Tax=Sphingomonas guangdongensis TaxID=1141890 RepID=A0A285QFX2_9SPHN|nr:hypothetical protein [Sphingomonas guangdongensis]SOB80384.1 hypothetical protein SAMN06297144_1034 [Sphingomonas guangdongensis]